MIATLFDFNGVLVDDEHVHLAAFRDVVRPLGITITDHAYRERYLGFDDYGAFRALLSDAGHTVSADRVKQLVNAKKPAYMARVAVELRIFDGAEELVMRRAARGPVGIVSGALAEEIAFALDKMGITKHVSVIVSAGSTPEGKPDPSQYLAAKLAIPAATRFVAVEDSIAGITSSRGASIGCVGVAHTYTLEELRAASADAVVPDLAALTDELLDGTAR